MLQKRYWKNKISLIIPTFNEEKYIKKTLLSIKSQNFKKFETLIIDSFSKDRTLEIAKRFKVKIVKTKRRNVGYARNLGARISKSEILVFLDADTLIPKNFLNRIFKIMNYGNIDLIGFELFPIEKNVLAKIVYSSFNLISKISSILKFPLISAACCAIKREAFFKAKGFDTKNFAMEDISLSLKVSKFGKVRCINLKVRTSARRVLSLGIKTFPFYIYLFLKFLMKKRIKKEEYINDYYV